MPTQQALSFNDLPALNSSPQAVRQKFQDLYSKKPDGISVNDETYFGAVTPAITQQYGHPCYKTLGEFNYVEAASKPPSDAIVGSNYATNDSDEEATITVTVEGAWSQTQSWSSESTTGLSFTEEFTIEGVFKVGTTFNVSTTVGQSKSNTVSKSASASVSVSVPAHSRKQITMVATMQQETLNFTAPISVQGMFGANFPDRVKGHYFWFNDATQLLPTTSGQIKGSISNTSALHVQTTVGKAEPVAALAASSK
ncbi:MAG TPA: hypothetical protein VN737_24675 [Bryobacteraceae bacterium]|jgi:hypothetical protein|nr:hypothetical protein [Bryobacteraceae bacterium]